MYSVGPTTAAAKVTLSQTLLCSDLIVNGAALLTSAFSLVKWSSVCLIHSCSKLAKCYPFRWGLYKFRMVMTISSMHVTSAFLAASCISQMARTNLHCLSYRCRCRPYFNGWSDKTEVTKENDVLTRLNFVVETTFLFWDDNHFIYG